MKKRHVAWNLDLPLKEHLKPGLLEVMGAAVPSSTVTGSSRTMTPFFIWSL